MTEERKNKRTYQSETLGLPPLKMVLVHAENDRKNASPKANQKATPKAQEIALDHDDLVKIIEHLKKKE